MLKIHEYKARVYYSDTDAAGIVYYANYLRFAEAARGELFRDAGFERKDFTYFEKCKGFAVAECNAKYKAPAQLDELLTVKTEILKLGGASMKLKQDIYRDDELLVEITLTMVCVGADLKSTRIPEDIRKAFAA